MHTVLEVLDAITGFGGGMAMVSGDGSGGGTIFGDGSGINGD